LGVWASWLRRRRLDRLLEPVALARVSRFARTLCRDPVSAEDLVQEALINALTRLDTLRDDAAFRVWMHRVVYTTFLDRQDREHRHQRRLEALAADRASAPLPFPTPADQEEARQLAGQLERAIAELPPEQRQVVVLVDIEGLSFAEVAHVLELKQGTVASRVARGRAALRVALWEAGAERGVVG
jgi:RNA polymerase sigma-70 factor (ECF subfamily)